ncbi:hypothetical protein KC19_VG042300 [Ceratodon purpureus]|uniref:Uncharacterized protein n=1 Tax=Ceratodon purpureus TaxID=3225 RepID=A0A8T0HLU3_CERPU|nr:hypothetical protein KC19_VG042300 [Ceratodon purpureus]
MIQQSLFRGVTSMFTLSMEPPPWRIEFSDHRSPCLQFPGIRIFTIHHPPFTSAVCFKTLGSDILNTNSSITVSSSTPQQTVHLIRHGKHLRGTFREVVLFKISFVVYI